MRWLLPLVLISATAARADSLVALHTIRAHTVLTAEDIGTSDKPLPGAATDPGQVIGLETPVALYKGMPIRPETLTEPAIVERNSTVPLLYRRAGLTIFAEGRALERGGAGQDIRVMNSASRAIVLGRIAPDGSVIINP